MTIWDDIYKNYQKGGEAWATLSEEIHPLFKQFLSQSNFELKHVLDIGCGNGKYLKILQAGDFKTDGIDSSETAVEMTKKTLGDDSTILCVNMFEFEIPKNKYDLVISISTIHHGTKEQVQNLINRIYEAIVENGKIFITVPDFESSKKWNTFKDHEEIANGTFAPLSGLEKGLPHSFYTKDEAQKLFSKFRNLQLDLDSHGRWVAQASK
ncbi:class I SAM-dependent methyltransferase [Candidatus Wolfebacteria bacterium]|nr:class I SAM-dependent methyltransferase [Candidatus Wolfebacteria bacterium]